MEMEKQMFDKQMLVGPCETMEQRGILIKDLCEVPPCQ